MLHSVHISGNFHIKLCLHSDIEELELVKKKHSLLGILFVRKIKRANKEEDAAFTLLAHLFTPLPLVIAGAAFLLFKFELF